MRSLSSLKAGESGVINHLSGSDSVAQRLLAMAMLPGKVVSVIRFAPLGDPMMIKIDNFFLSLRKKEASSVLIDDLPKS